MGLKLEIMLVTELPETDLMKCSLNAERSNSKHPDLLNVRKQYCSERKKTSWDMEDYIKIFGGN